MTLNSIAFFGFFGAVLLFYWTVPVRFRNWLLLLSSAIFYLSWDTVFPLILLISIFSGYWFGRKIEETPDRKRALHFFWAGVAVNLSILAVFKSFDFFKTGFVIFMASLGSKPGEFWSDVALPIGLSFYTFQCIGYLTDIYRGHAKAEKNLLNFAVFMAYFPKLIAGPIERSKTLLPQLNQTARFDLQRFYDGCWLIASGLYKKIFIADNLAYLCGLVFKQPEEASSLAILVSIYAYAIQLYADFSGYTDMARGFSKMLGLELSENFQRPYLAKNPQEFWSKWHISLTTWIRDYLFYPLALLKIGKWKMPLDAAVFISFVVMGLWHGTSWNYVVWGAYWGIILVLYRWYKSFLKKGEERSFPGKQAVNVVLLFHAAAFGALLLGSESLSHAGRIIASLFNNPFMLDKDILFLMNVFKSSSLEVAAAAFPSNVLLKAAGFYVFPMIFYAGPLLAYEICQNRSGAERPVSLLPVPLRACIYCILYFSSVIYGQYAGETFVYAGF